MVKDTIEHHIRQTDPLSLISEGFLSEPSEPSSSYINNISYDTVVRIKKKMMWN
jgi:hypothetical protein